MATRLSPLGQIVKWLVVPALLAATGYYFVGPRVTDKLPPEIKERVQAATAGNGRLSTSTSPESATNGDPLTSGKPFAAPEVDVTVSQLGNPEKPKKKKRRRRRKPPVEAPSPSIPGPDSPSGQPNNSPPPQGENG